MEAIVFIGIQASGKSTFYKNHFFTTHVRINLDMLRTRRREAILLNACLQAGQRFVVDNTNCLVSDRAQYITLAKASNFRVIAYYFPTTLADTLRRNAARLGKERIPEKGVIAKFHQLQIPTLAEGFDQLYHAVITENGAFEVQEQS